MHEVPRWFVGARLNLAENLLWPNDDHTAIISTGEGHGITRTTYRQLRDQVAECAAALKRLGVSQLDRVTGVCLAARGPRTGARADRPGRRFLRRFPRRPAPGYVTNCAEAVVMMLATASLGAIWSSTSPDFGVSVRARPPPPSPGQTVAASTTRQCSHAVHIALGDRTCAHVRASWSASRKSSPRSSCP